jgi:hypothetical protein
MIEHEDFTIGDPLYREGGYLQSVRVARYPGVAFYALGWEVQPTEETEWSGIKERTGRIVCEMVGDDRPFCFDPRDITPLPRADYCGECGQIGCRCDGFDRDEEVTDQDESHDRGTLPAVHQA